MRFTVDASVFLADLIPEESQHAAAAQFLKWISEDNHSVVIPLTIPLEVINVIGRKLSRESEWAVSTLQAMFFQNEVVTIREIQLDFVQPFSENCKSLNLKTADAIIALSALQEGSTLVSFDRELIRKAKKLVSAKLPQELISKNR